MSAPGRERSAGPLAGVRVLDLTSVILGPYATQMLGDLGADVIKIEPPEGDTTRYTGPARNSGMASLFMGVNRNKRSVVLDLKQAAARDVLMRMVDRADVFVHNIRPQKLEKIGLGPDALLSRNPRLSTPACMAGARAALTAAVPPTTTSSRGCAASRA